MTEIERICVSFRDQSADWSWESVIPLYQGRGERIATAVNRSLVRNDRFFARSAVQVRRRGEGTPPYGTVCRGGRLCPPAPDNATPCRAGPVCPAVGAGKIRVGPSGKSAKRCQWQMKRAGFEEVPRLADTTVAGNRLARRWATAGPYGSATRGAMGGRPQGSPLRMGCKRCSGQATTRVALTEAGLWGHEDFFVFMQIYTGKTAWDLLYSSL